MKSNQFSKQLRLKVIRSLMALLWKKSAKKCILCSFIFKIILLLWTHLQDVSQPSGGCFHWLSWQQKMLRHLPALSPCRLGSCPVNEKICLYQCDLSNSKGLFIATCQPAVHVGLAMFWQGAQHLTYTQFRTGNSACSSLLVALLSWEPSEEVVSWMMWAILMVVDLPLIYSHRGHAVLLCLVRSDFLHMSTSKMPRNTLSAETASPACSLFPFQVVSGRQGTRNELQD